MVDAHGPKGGPGSPTGDDTALHPGLHIDAMYQDWFLDYASYVILDRAVPYLADGLKPVQRRLLYTLKLMDDGRFHKVANVVGRTMMLHPHGDASIYEALVGLGQKGLLLDTQGNWGNAATGDPAAAARYIEVRLSKFALETLFHPELTTWQLSYDGRMKEPVTLPAKFPILLVHGVEGIAVGLATKILPHNFQEICKQAIKVLEGKKPKLLPDFPSGGIADISDYQGGKRGGRVRVRAKIDILDAKTLCIRELPFGITTGRLIDSILAANDKGKIRIKRIDDNTAENVEILVHLPQGVSPDVTVDALYAFTDCEVSISPNCCIIHNAKPQFITVNELLEISVLQTRELLKRELEIKLNELEDKWHFLSLERIFIEHKVYRRIEDATTWEAILERIASGLKPHLGGLKREVTQDDIVRLTEIKIKRISKYDSDKANDAIKALESEIKTVKLNLQHLTEYTIAWFEHLLETYGQDHPRRTTLAEFGKVEAAQVAAATHKLYVNRADGFIGTGLKKDEFVADVSALDEVIAICADGTCTVTRVADKVFVGKDILYVAPYKRGDERSVYHMVYRDGRTGAAMVKRFTIPAVVRDRTYNLTAGSEHSKVLYLAVHAQGEAETVTVHLKDTAKARIKVFDFDFGELPIRGRDAKGNILTKYPIKKIVQKAVGPSTLAPERLWYDPSVGLNRDERGTFLGEFRGDDRILAVYEYGEYEVTDFNPQNIYGGELRLIQKLPPGAVASVVYWHGERKEHYVKRFAIDASVLGKRIAFLPGGRSSKIEVISLEPEPQIRIEFKKGKKRTPDPIHVNLAEFIEPKGVSALGNKLARHEVKKITLLDKTANNGADTPSATGTHSSSQGTLFSSS